MRPDTTLSDFTLPQCRNVVLLSTADWDNPFWTNKQHVASALSRLGYRVLYIDSLGLRQPSASIQDISRIAKRLRKGIRSPTPVGQNLWVWSPVVIPLQRYKLVRGLNRILFGMGLKFWRWRLGMREAMLWTYNPMTLRFASITSFMFTVYHCVDEVKAQPGMPAEQIAAAERGLVEQTDVCFVTAEGLLEERKTLNEHTYCFSNVADFAHFSKALQSATQVPDDLASLPAPRIGFIGAISGYKVDFPLLVQMAKAHPEWSIVMIGKVGEGDPWTDASALKSVPNLHLLGPRSYQTLPAYLKGFDVAILPSVLNEYTRGMFPMKFFEYLAAGKPVVSTNLSAVQAYSHVACLATDADEFIAGVEQAVQGQGAPLELRLEVAREHTYERRMQRMLGVIESVRCGKAEMASA